MTKSMPVMSDDKKIRVLKLAGGEQLVADTDRPIQLATRQEGDKMVVTLTQQFGIGIVPNTAGQYPSVGSIRDGKGTAAVLIATEAPDA